MSETVIETRTFVVALQPGLKLLSLNDRFHWRERHRRTQVLKEATWARVLEEKIPRMERVRIAVEYQPPDRRHRDADNPVASVKGCVDGIVAAKVIKDDESPRYVSYVKCFIGTEMFPKGRLVIYIGDPAPGEWPL
jgi:crossover junction endodeoxyribonuclease RusA